MLFINSDKIKILLADIGFQLVKKKTIDRSTELLF